MSLRALLNAFPLPALVVDADAEISVANQLIEEVLGPDLEGHNYVSILRKPELVEAIETSLQEGTDQTVRIESRTAYKTANYDVTVRWIEADSAAGATGPGVLVCFEDTSRVEQADLMRREFVANVSHELRTPLTALMGFIETLRGPARGDAQAQARFLDIMDREAARMNRLVGDLLSLSRVENNERAQPKQTQSVTDILNATIQTLREVAADAGLRIEAQLGEDPMYVVGDRDQLAQVFTNVIENAIKYAASGERITVKLEAIRHDPFMRGPAVCIHFIDYGPGIAPYHLPRLTERFYRADSQRNREMGGTGLGLAIVKHILNRHRGRLRVTSEVGKGSVFKVFFPRAPKQTS